MSSVRWFKPWDPFALAVTGGTLATIEALLPSTPDLRAACFNGIVEYNQVLHIPIFLDAMHWNKDIKVWDLFLSAGVNINIRDSNGSTALHSACMFGKFEVVKYLVEHVANINEKYDKCTPIEIAANGNYSNLVAYLASHGAKMTSGTPEMMEIYNKNRVVAEDIKAAVGTLFFETKRVPVAVGKTIIGRFLDNTARQGVVPVNRETSAAAKNERRKIADRKIEQKNTSTKIIDDPAMKRKISVT